MSGRQFIRLHPQMEIRMKKDLSFLAFILRYKTHLNIGALLAVGLWAAWITWLTRPSEIDTPAPSAICCMRQVRTAGSPLATESRSADP